MSKKEIRSFSISADTYKQFKADCEQGHIKMSQVVDLLIKEYLQEKQEEAEQCIPLTEESYAI